MRLFLIILIISIFLQTSFLPINLGLILLLCKSLVDKSAANYYFAFGSGIMLGILSVENIGFWPLIFLIAVKIASFAEKLPVSVNILTTLLISALVIVGATFADKIFLDVTINWIKVVVEVGLCLPIYFIVKICEERMKFRGDIRLKFRGN